MIIRIVASLLLLIFNKSIYAETIDSSFNNLMSYFEIKSFSWGINYDSAKVLKNLLFIEKRKSDGGPWVTRGIEGYRFPSKDVQLYYLYYSDTVKMISLYRLEYYLVQNKFTRLYSVCFYINEVDIDSLENKIKSCGYNEIKEDKSLWDIGLSYKMFNIYKKFADSKTNIIIDNDSNSYTEPSAKVMKNINIRRNGFIKIIMSPL